LGAVIMFQLYVRDANLNRIGEITDFNKLDLIPRFNDVGSFVLDIPTDSSAAKDLIKPKAGIIVKKDGKPLLSGTITSRKRSFSASGDSMTLSGKDDMKFIADTLAYPETSGRFNLSAYDVRT